VYLRDYTAQGGSWLDHLLSHGCHPLLADEMGLGKTLQVLSLLRSRMNGESAPALVVAPASVVPVWQAEAAAHFPEMKVQVLSADNPICGDPGVLWLSSYGQIKRHNEELDAVNFGFAVLDEAQMIKNPSTKAAKTCYHIKAAPRWRCRDPG
jgi:SNF2 family DNA or RNA helicase